MPDLSIQLTLICNAAEEAIEDSLAINVHSGNRWETYNCVSLLE